jgi:hypothetical protein
MNAKFFDAIPETALKQSDNGSIHADWPSNASIHQRFVRSQVKNISLFFISLDKHWLKIHVSAAFWCGCETAVQTVKTKGSENYKSEKAGPKAVNSLIISWILRTFHLSGNLR